MPDTRRHRGPHPEDAELFVPAVWPVLREATDHLSWLLTRGYSERSSLKLVGDRFQLTERQRLAVMRSACSDQAMQRRRQTEVSLQDVAGQRLDLDGFNVLTTVEAALAGGVILCGRDGCYRDLASMHGSYRKVQETEPALALVGEVLAEVQAGPCIWYLDRPVSNSGRLRSLIVHLAADRGWAWQAELADNPDAVLITSVAIVVSADSVILDGCGRWLNLAREVIRRRLTTVEAIPPLEAYE
jgi:hypothetical protein